MTTLAKDIGYAPNITIVNAIAEHCPHCVTLKESLPALEETANALGISLYNIEATEENREFFETYQNESLPYTFVFDNGNFVGGDSFDAAKLEELLHILSAKMDGIDVNISG